MSLDSFRTLCADSEKRGQFVELITGKRVRMKRIGNGRNEIWRDIVEMRVTDRKHRTLRSTEMRGLGQLNEAAEALLLPE